MSSPFELVGSHQDKYYVTDRHMSFFDRRKSYYDRQKSVSKIWLLIGKGLDRRLRDRQKSKGKSLIGVCVIGKYLETALMIYTELVL